MNIIRFFSFLTIFALLYLSTTGWLIKRKKSHFYIQINSCLSIVVHGREDDVEIGDEEEPVLQPDETVTQASDVLVRNKLRFFNNLLF